MLTALTLATLASLSPAAGNALVYKCVTADKSTRYSDVRCEASEACFTRSSEGIFNQQCEPVPIVKPVPPLPARAVAGGDTTMDPCRAEAKCWGQKFLGDVDGECRPLVERYAKYQFRWEDGWLDRKFDHVLWTDKSAGVIDYSGDWISMQNGFGAWQRMEYECEFNTITKSVVKVYVYPRK